MIAVAGRAGSLASALKVSNQTVASGAKIVAVRTSPPITLERKTVASGSQGGYLSNGGFLTASSGISVSGQIRCASTESSGTFKEIRNSIGGGHYDIPTPNFDEYRHSTSLDPTSQPLQANEQRKAFTYVMIGTTFAGTAYFAKNLVRSMINYIGPAADALAAGSIEVNLDSIPEGKSVTFKWRGKPLFVKHRTAKQIEKEEAEDLASLRDPEHDSARVIDSKWLVLIGICTHLGCVPIADAGDYGGYYCPCHGSHYDGSGRIRKGPAPTNLEIPPYTFPSPGLLVVG